MHTRTVPTLAACLVCLCAPRAMGQETFADSSRLRDTAYLAHQVQEIPDSALWAALDLSRPGLEPARRAARAGAYGEAARAWGAYWAAKPQPSYITRMDHLLLDTDLLMPVDSLAASLRASPAERDTVLVRAGQLMRNVIRTWGDSTIAFGDSVDFNREIGTSGKYGFHYWFWSRPLLMAAVLTGDRAYLRKFEELFTAWYSQRNRITRTIPSLDPVYYELGLGTRNRMFIEFYLLARNECPPETQGRLLKTLLGAARWLHELERWEGYRPGNWQIHGSYMLTQIALAFPEFRESGSWLEAGLGRMKAPSRIVSSLRVARIPRTSQVGSMR